MVNVDLINFQVFKDGDGAWPSTGESRGILSPDGGESKHTLSKSLSTLESINVGRFESVNMGRFKYLKVGRFKSVNMGRLAQH